MDQIPNQIEQEIRLAIQLGSQILSQIVQKQKLKQALNQQSIQADIQKDQAAYKALAANAKAELAAVKHDRWWASASASDIQRLWLYTQQYASEDWAKIGGLDLEEQLEARLGFNIQDLVAKDQAIASYYDQTKAELEKIIKNYSLDELAAYDYPTDMSEAKEFRQAIAKQFSYNIEYQENSWLDPYRQQNPYTKPLIEILETTWSKEKLDKDTQNPWEYDSDERRKQRYEQAIRFGIDPQVAKAAYLADVSQALPANGDKTEPATKPKSRSRQSTPKLKPRRSYTRSR